MKTEEKENRLNSEAADPLENALDILVEGMSYSEALEYCADPVELTRALEKIAATLGTPCRGITAKEAFKRLRAYGIELPVY